MPWKKFPIMICLSVVIAMFSNLCGILANIPKRQYMSSNYFGNEVISRNNNGNSETSNNTAHIILTSNVNPYNMKHR